MTEEHILIIHDQQLRRDQMRNALGGFLTVTLATGINEAIAILKEREHQHLDAVPFDLIICCVHIEGDANALTVFDLLKWVKGNPQCKEIPFILLCSEPSGKAKYLVDSIRLAGRSLGANGYMIIEEFDAEPFARQIESYLSERRDVEPDGNGKEGVSSSFKKAE